MAPQDLIPLLLGLAVLAPLASFTLILLVGPKMGPAGRHAPYFAIGAILSAFALSIASLVLWVGANPFVETPHHGNHHEAAADDHHTTVTPAPNRTGHDTNAHLTGFAQPITSVSNEAPHHHDDHDSHAKSSGDSKPVYAGEYNFPLTGQPWVLGQFGSLRLSISYYIDSLTISMFCMVTLIASCIHFYAVGYMHEELEDVTDHEVTLQDGSHLKRPGRFHRFFQYLSLFCFSMLGLVISGNVAMTFVFWELVGICSYFLIGFYVERHSASTAANKAFIVNRVGDFGMIIGLMALWASLGTFQFGDIDVNQDGKAEAGLFTLVRPPEQGHQLVTPAGMVQAAATSEIRTIYHDHLYQPEGSTSARSEVEARTEQWRNGPEKHGYWLLVIAGVGIFCGCVGKSAQFPLHTWLPDAMEGPTPVSALVHSATMVAAGVFLVGRFFPVFAPEVLLVIAVAGTITLFMAATIAITATDIKRVLAYSTVSQLGYMMLALGAGGWLAGMMHLFTHAFFKSLLFLCSGSVIHAVHTNEMPQMGGLLKKMPWTGWTMLIGCMAIAGAGIPFVIGMSGYYSKDAILEQLLSFSKSQNDSKWTVLFFFAAAGGAAITAFYMFRLWFLTFLGTPRDADRYDHAHESPPVMYVPLVILAVFAIGVAWPIPGINLTTLLEQSRPLGTNVDSHGELISTVWPDEHKSHADEIKTPATLIAFATALSGFLLASVMYWWKILNPDEVRRQFQSIYHFLIKKWWFDELYDFLWVRPSHLLAKFIAWLDTGCIDGLINGLANSVRRFCHQWDIWIDRWIVDGRIDSFAGWIYRTALSMRSLQTGQLRQYVLFIVIATVALFILVSFFWNYTLAG